MFFDISLIPFYITQHIVLESIWEGIWKMGDQAGWVTCAGSWLPKCVGGVGDRAGWVTCAGSWLPNSVGGMGLGGVGNMCRLLALKVCGRVE